MPSQFFGLTIAGSGLQSYQAAVNVTANNISNVDTEGYTRQEALLEAAQSLRIHAKYGSMGSGVEVSKIQQLRDVYYDMKYWSNTSKLGEQSTKADYLKQIETYFKDDETVTGFTTIFGKLFDSLDTLKTDSASLTTRNSYISACQTLAEYFNSINTSLTNLQTEVNDVIATQVEDINGIAQKIASLNKQINILEQQGGNAAELRDSRNLLLDELSSIVPIETKEIDVVNSNNPDYKTGATIFQVKINGQSLVDSYEYSQLVCVPRDTDEKVNVSDAEGLYDIYWTMSSTNNEPSSMKLEVTSNTMTGSLKGLFELRDGNNNNGFSGTLGLGYPLTGSGPTTITINSPSITNSLSMTMPEEGVILISNREYRYDGYTLIEDTDATGKKTYSYQFNLTTDADGAPISRNDINRLQGQPVTIGTSIDYKGIAYYQEQLNEFVRSFAKAYNDIVDDMHGVNQNGQDANPFFVANNLVSGGEYDYTKKNYDVVDNGDGTSTTSYRSDYYYNYLNSGNFTVCAEAMKDPSTIATQSYDAWVGGVDSYDIAESLLGLKSELSIFRGAAASDFLQCLLSDISVDTQKAEIFTTNYENLQTAITNQRMSISAVDSDEEALNLIKFQNAYNLSSKVVSILQEMYDQLILSTGA